MARVEDMFHKMMRRFDANDEHIKELRSDLAGIRQKVNTHAISIKQIELQMAQLSATVNTWQLGTLPSNTVQNPKNDGHCMAITTRSGNQTIDPPMPSNEAKVTKDNDKVVDVSSEVEDNTGKDAEVPKKVTLMPRPPLSSKISEKDRGWLILAFYNNVEEAFYQCPFGRSSRTNSQLRQVYERSGYKEKIGHFRG